MRYVELICRAARAAHDEHAGIGVRLSPVRLSAEEATALTTTARALLGPNVYVAVAAPGVSPIDDERTCLSAGDHAAERATAWRNQVNPAEGEWILYVSVERLGRAGGLQDTLRAIDEGALRRALLKGEGGAPSVVPKKLAEALMGSGVADRAPTQALCALHEALSAAPEDQRWEIAGRSLPLLGLAADSRLQDRTEDRLRGNLRWVQEAGAREVRGEATKQPLKGELAAALSGGARQEALRRVDLGAVTTDVLSPPPKTRARPAAPATPPRPAPPPKATERQTAPAAPPPVARPKTPPTPSAPPASPALAPSLEDEPGPPRTAAEELPAVQSEESGGAEPVEIDEVEDEPTDPGRPPTPPTPARGVNTGPAPVQLTLPPRVKAPKPAPWEVRQVPGESAAFIEAALRGGGECLSWEIRGGAPRAALERPPTGLPRPRALALPVMDRQAADALEAWTAARARLVDELAALGVDAASLSRSPAIPFGALEAAGGAAQALVDASACAVTRLAEAEPTALPGALARDALLLHSPVRGESLLLLTPLHPLVVGAALARAEVWRQARHVPTDERGPILWALSQAPPAAPRWPAPVVGPLLAAASLAGLPVFETRPTSIPDGALADAAEALTRRFLELHPHARLGLKVLIDTENCGPLIEGVAEAILADAGAAPRVMIYATGAPALSERVGPLVSEGRLTLASPPAGPAERAGLAPHLEILVPRPTATSAAAVTMAPGDGPLPRPARRVVDGGWEVHTPARAVVGGAALEAAVARALGEPARGAFVARISAPPLSSSAQADRGTWRAILAPQLGPAPRIGPLVLIDERLADARLAVMSQDVRAVARAMSESFRALGVRDTRPNVVESLVKQLARATGGALPLEGPPQRALVARVLARVVADGLGDGAVMTQVRDELLSAIQPDLRAGGAPLVVGAALGRNLSVKVGVALMDLAPDAVLPEQAQLVVAEVAAWALRAGRPEKLAGAACRGLMADLLWPRLAAMAPKGEALAWLLEGSAATEVSVSAVVLAPAGSALVGRPGLKVGDVPVEIVALDHALVQRVVLGAG